MIVLRQPESSPTQPPRPQGSPGDPLPITPPPAPAPEAPPAVEAMLIPDTVAAALAGISRSTLHVLRAAGRWGPEPIRLGRAVRYRRAEVEEWIAAGCPDRRTWEALQAQRNGRPR